MSKCGDWAPTAVVIGTVAGVRSWLRCAVAVACVLMAAPMVQAEEKYTKTELIKRLNPRTCQMIHGEYQEDTFPGIKKRLAGMGKRYTGEAITVEEAYPYIRCVSPRLNDVGLDLLATVVESFSTFARDKNGIALIDYLSREAQDPYLLRKIVACRKDTVPAAPTGRADWDSIGVAGCRDLLESTAVNTKHRARLSCPGMMEYIDLNPFAAARDLEAVGFTREQARTVTDPYSTVRELEAVGFTHKQAQAVASTYDSRVYYGIHDHLWDNYPTSAALMAAGFARQVAIDLAHVVIRHHNVTGDETVSDNSFEDQGFTGEQVEALFRRGFTTEREYEALGFTREQARVLVAPRKVALRLYLEDLGLTREQAEAALDARDVGYNFAVAGDLEAAGATRDQAETAVKAMRSGACLDDFWIFTKTLYDRLDGGPLRDQAFCQEVLYEPLHCAD